MSDHLPDPSHPPARWDLPDQTSMEWLRKQAKRLRKGVASGDPEALDLVSTFDPGDGPVGLTRAQRVLARSFGFAGWSRLREHLEVRSLHTRGMEASYDGESPIDAFLRAAVLSYTDPARTPVATAMLDSDPSLASATTATLAATGRAAELRALLDEDPALVAEEGGPHRWVPLLYLCYSRVPQQDAVGTMRTLLDHGADPDAGFLWKGFPSPFTALTGVLGGGERDEPPHPEAVTLATMLLDAGADPNDNQAFYNRMFRPDDAHLGPLLAHGAGHPRPSPWRERLGTAYPSPAEMVGEHLRSAAEKGFTHRVRLLLEAGVDPNTEGYQPTLGDATAYEVAITHGQAEAAALLEAAGGRSDRLTEDDLAIGRAMAGHAGRPAGGLAARRPDAVRLAAELHGIPALEALMSLGYDVSTPGRWRTTALHEAALRGDEELCGWLLDHGADRSATDERFGSTPAGWAAHAGYDELAARLAPPAEET